LYIENDIKVCRGCSAEALPKPGLGASTGLKFPQMVDQAATGASKELERVFAWLADAPLFIDREQLGRLYDAVVRPLVEHGEVAVTFGKETTSTLGMSGEGSAGVEFSPGELLELVSKYLPSLKAKVEGKGAVEFNKEAHDQETRTITLRPIKTPQRQLLQLALHYVANHPQRILLTRSDPAFGKALGEVSAQVLEEVPRILAFIDLPGHREAEATEGLKPTMFIPMAGEFANGAIALPFKDLERDGREMAPRYTEYSTGVTAAELQTAREPYWDWFERRFNAGRALELVESCASQHGRIRWIDFRLPLSGGSRPLHLHIQPAGEFDTGTFGYRLIKRGFDHGVRLVGILKSGPDLEVLAIYEK
jgi:hypothetical protein